MKRILDLNVILPVKLPYFLDRRHIAQVMTYPKLCTNAPDEVSTAPQTNHDEQDPHDVYYQDRILTQLNHGNQPFRFWVRTVFELQLSGSPFFYYLLNPL